MERQGQVRILAALTAVIGWAGLALQLWLIIANIGLPLGSWRFIGFFTILTNILVAVMATTVILGRRHWITRPVPRMAITAAILLVGVTYWTLLAGLWNPTGWQLVADTVLHSVQPLLAATLWWALRDGSLQWRDLPKAALWPAIYVVYALARGQIDGWYAYWFLNPNEQSADDMALSILGLLAAILSLAAALVAADRARRATV